jgi:protein O-mannosyl-transferase
MSASAIESEIPPSSAKGNRLFTLQRTWLRCAVLCIVGVAARWPALSGQLVWDDTFLTRDNPFIKSPLLILETFRHTLFPEASSGHYRPVQNISYCLDYLIWNNNAFGYHLTNVLLHLTASILLYFLARRLLRALTPHAAGIAAFLVALLWSVHPVHSAAVDYISGRADSLAFVFACAAWLCYLRGSAATPVAWKLGFYTASSTAGLLALCSRESAAIWMLLFLVHLFTFGGGTSIRRKVLTLAACVALLGGYASLRQLPPRGATTAIVASQPATTRAVLMLRALGDYGRLLIFPSNLHVERTVHTADGLLVGHIGGERLAFVGLVFAAALAYGACRRGKARPLRAFGACWFALAFLPVSNLFQLNASVAEHWLYLPAVGFVLFLAGCCLELPARALPIIAAAAAVAVLALSARSYVRSGDWMDAETFYRQTLRAGGAKTRMALNLGQIYVERGDYAKAEPLLRKVAQMNPDYPMAQNALGHVLSAQGKCEEAEVVLAEAERLAQRLRKEEPRTWIAALNRAAMQHKAGNMEAALAIISEARAAYPATWPVLGFEAELRRTNGDAAGAIPFMEEFVQANWWHASAALVLGRLYLDQRQFADAEKVLRLASRLDVHDAEALNLLALVRIGQNRMADAYKTQRQAIERQPDQPQQYRMLSDILARMGRADDARLLLAQATAMESGSIQ